MKYHNLQELLQNSRSSRTFFRLASSGAAVQASRAKPIYPFCSRAARRSKRAQGTGPSVLPGQMEPEAGSSLNAEEYAAGERSNVVK